MDGIKLAETVCLQLESFWILQELDALLAEDSDSAQTLMNEIYSCRATDWHTLLPVVRGTTALTLLALPMALACRLSDGELVAKGFEVKDKYSLQCRENGKPDTFSPKVLLTVLRNAVAHMPDFAAGQCAKPNIWIEGEAIHFWTESKCREVVVTTSSGYHQLLNDIVALCRSAASDLLSC